MAACALTLHLKSLGELTFRPDLALSMAQRAFNVSTMLPPPQPCRKMLKPSIMDKRSACPVGGVLMPAILHSHPATQAHRKQ